MGLISLQTNLTQLKYGQDRKGGGSSGQPYITHSPTDTSLENNLSEDFLLRGGIRAITDSGEDVLRLGKFFTDINSPKGLLFAVKQNMLSRVAVKTQSSKGAGYGGGYVNEGIYTPLNTLLQAGGNAFGIHLAKQGLLPNVNGPGGIKTYGSIVTQYQTAEDNRLVNFYKEQIAKFSLDPINLISYSGGPGSILGIGKTTIKTASDRTGLASGKNFISYQVGLKNSSTDRTDKVLNFNKLLGVSNIFNISSSDNGFNTTGDKLVNHDVYLSNTLEPNNIFYQDSTQNIFLLNYSQSQNLSIINKSDKLIGSPDGIDFRKEVLPTNGKSTIMSLSPSYKFGDGKTIESRVHLGDPGKSQGKNLISYSSGTGRGVLDKINAKPLYTSKTVSKEDTNDLVKFRIATIDSNGSGDLTFIHFRAFIDSFNDSYSSDWSGFKYPGRGESFYTYGGFDRKISMQWTVYAQSREELIPMYKKLNYLASNLAPDYSDTTGFMRGPLVQLTVGGYLYEQPGFITGLTFDISNESTWEIGITDNGEKDPGDVKELPHMIKVSGFNFTPIHKFLPRKVTTPEGIQDAQFIALDNGITNNY